MPLRATEGADAVTIAGRVQLNTDETAWWPLQNERHWTAV